MVDSSALTTHLFRRDGLLAAVDMQNLHHRRSRHIHTCTQTITTVASLLTASRFVVLRRPESSSITTLILTILLSSSSIIMVGTLTTWQFQSWEESLLVCIGSCQCHHGNTTLPVLTIVLVLVDRRCQLILRLHKPFLVV
jgi:hypothetical protein